MRRMSRIVTQDEADRALSRAYTRLLALAKQRAADAERTLASDSTPAASDPAALQQQDHEEHTT